MDEIIQYVKNALSRVYKNHYYLIQNRVSERSIVFWFGVYFREIIQETEYSRYDLDIEYNRNMKKAKKTEQFQHGTYPDLILHKRGNNENNILIVEFKPWWNTEIVEDMKKLIDFTDERGTYKYSIGLSILLGKDEPTGFIFQKCEIVGKI